MPAFYDLPVFYDFVGAPQIAAILLLAQRGLEELHSMRNTKRLMGKGAKEEGANYYPVVAVTHLAWIASLAFLIPASTQVSVPLLALYLVLQVIRYWVLGTIGQYWTHRIITLPDAPIVKKGPYSFVRHPNYVVTLTETALLPLVFGAFSIAVIMTAIWGAVLSYKIILEDKALASRRKK